MRGARVCLATTSAVLELQSDLVAAPFAYVFAVLLALILALCWPAQERSSWGSISAGAGA